jgi:hypothetical protein
MISSYIGTNKAFYKLTYLARSRSSLHLKAHLLSAVLLAAKAYWLSIPRPLSERSCKRVTCPFSLILMALARSRATVSRSQSGFSTTSHTYWKKPYRVIMPLSKHTRLTPWATVSSAYHRITSMALWVASPVTTANPLPNKTRLGLGLGNVNFNDLIGRRKWSDHLTICGRLLCRVDGRKRQGQKGQTDRHRVASAC